MIYSLLGIFIIIFLYLSYFYYYRILKTRYTTRCTTFQWTCKLILFQRKEIRTKPWILTLFSSLKYTFLFTFSCQFSESSMSVWRFCNGQSSVETSLASCIRDKHILVTWQIYVCFTLYSVRCFKKVLRLVVALKHDEFRGVSDLHGRWEETRNPNEIRLTANSVQLVTFLALNFLGKRLNMIFWIELENSSKLITR